MHKLAENWDASFYVANKKIATCENLLVYITRHRKFSINLLMRMQLVMESSKLPVRTFHKHYVVLEAVV